MSIGRPICNHCKYDLTGLTQSSRCPECGRPIVEVLVRDKPVVAAGRRYESATRVFGLPLIHIAQGPTETEHRGKARGIIAIGDTATGLVAIGGRALGVIALGGLSMGVWCVGGLGFGVIAFGGLAIGLVMATGGGACGTIAAGGGALGVVATGGLAVGYFARGGQGVGRYVLDGRTNDVTAQAFFSDWGWLVGSPKSLSSPFQLWTQAIPLLSVFALLTILAVIVVIAILLQHRRNA